jgi:hypothetical protein
VITIGGPTRYMSNHFAEDDNGIPNMWADMTSTQKNGKIIPMDHKYKIGKNMEKNPKLSLGRKRPIFQRFISP